MMGITPAFDLMVGGASILARLNGRAMSISVSDSAGTESDTVSIEIEAGDRLVALPAKGAVMAVSLGYVETGLLPMGLYTVDEVKVSGPPVAISITGKAADMRATLKQHRTQHYEGKTLGDIVSEIAGRHGLSPQVSDSLAQRKIPYLGQTEESDLHLLSRLARAHGATAAPKNGKLVFARRGSGQSATGMAMQSLTLTPAMVTEFDIQLPDRPAVKTVTGHWHDRAKVKREKEEAQAGGQDSGFLLRNDFPSRDEAKWAAESKADELQRAGGSFSATLPGTPSLGAEAVVNTSGFYPGTDMAWTVKTATHEWSTSGATTQISCEAKT